MRTFQIKFPYRYIDKCAILLPYEMYRPKFSLLTGRTIDQGCGKEYGKLSDEYLKSVSLCEMNLEDMGLLGVEDGKNIRVTTRFGSVVVQAKKSPRISKPGIIFIPYGPCVNLLSSSETDGTGMPLLKGEKATVEPTEEEVLSLEDLILLTYGTEKIKSGR